MPDEEAIAPQHNAAGRLPWVGSGVLQGLIYTNFRRRSIAVFGTYSCKNYIQSRASRPPVYACFELIQCLIGYGGFTLMPRH